MNKPIPAINETPEERQRLLHTESDAQKHQRVQALSRIQTHQARTRRQGAGLLGLSRHTGGRWLAASQAGGVTQRLMIATAPGQVPLLSPARQQALRER